MVIKIVNSEQSASKHSGKCHNLHGKPIVSPLPMRHGVSASRVWLPKNGDQHTSKANTHWETMLDFLVERFAFIPQDILIDRMQRGEIVLQDGTAITPNSRYRPEVFLFYYREIPDEEKIPFTEEILYQDENIIVVDKPHFIPVTPTGRFVRESLLARLKHKLQVEEISPIHRLDRETAGVIMFTRNKAIRGKYQMLFQSRLVEKTYSAIAPTLADHQFPFTYRSRIVKSEPFFIMREEKGKENSETIIDIKSIKGDLAHYSLMPVTGRQHQLRVHMMALDCPILNDPFYPKLLPCKGNEYSKPLQLLAQSIAFSDPLTGEKRFFKSKQRLKF